ncbi:RNA-splicing ligase RtcB [Porphyridium purpureum]|uniref:3'-phosphate/5'-hydroxy nucleic acid ligase n=1 Tax=Porphyridium purpureum TaxID=35688 RepID=A0A5J4Z1Z1_PORPP|nr:RNA-splicing ligase RtcB [Porphyridium purpureum]|eukprot:POR7623..scf208_2
MGSESGNTLSAHSRETLVEMGAFGVCAARVAASVGASVRPPVQGLRYAHTVLHQGGSKRVPLKMWTQGLPPLEKQAEVQLLNTALLTDIIHPQGIAVMPDAHLGMGATVGSVIPTTKAIIPAAVGVDIGCGMVAHKTTMRAKDLPDSLREIRLAIEKAVPHGRSDGGGANDEGAWKRGGTPRDAQETFRNELAQGFARITARHPKLGRGNLDNHLGTLGTGNHFIEVCLDGDDNVWVMLHSGSRGVGNRIGTYFIELAKKDMRQHLRNLPDQDLAYLKKGTQHFDDYMHAVQWAQQFARLNRKLMMAQVLGAMRSLKCLPDFKDDQFAVECHHNYVSIENHFGEELMITRKGAVRADEGMYGIIPGSMGAKSFIVRGKGNPHSYNTCSHGAGRLLSRTAAKKKFTVAVHELATQGVECRKDLGVVDETPAAYKPIELVMGAQEDLVDIAYTLKQILCVKG